MTTPGLSPEFTMNFTFKLVYTTIMYNIEISSRENMAKLFDMASSKFSEYINYNKYYIDFVIAGQPKGELASAVNERNLDDPLDYEFGDKYKQISFYVRPMERETDCFVRMESYNEEIIDFETSLAREEPSYEEPTTHEEQENIPPPPGLLRQSPLDRIEYI
jgi:hypothetical protein